MWFGPGNLVEEEDEDVDDTSNKSWDDDLHLNRAEFFKLAQAGKMQEGAEKDTSWSVTEWKYYLDTWYNRAITEVRRIVETMNEFVSQASFKDIGKSTGVFAEAYIAVMVSTTFAIQKYKTRMQAHPTYEFKYWNSVDEHASVVKRQAKELILRYIARLGEARELDVWKEARTSFEQWSETVRRWGLLPSKQDIFDGTSLDILVHLTESSVSREKLQAQRTTSDDRSDNSPAILEPHSADNAARSTASDERLEEPATDGSLKAIERVADKATDPSVIEPVANEEDQEGDDTEEEVLTENDEDAEDSQLEEETAARRKPVDHRPDNSQDSGASDSLIAEDEDHVDNRGSSSGMRPRDDDVFLQGSGELRTPAVNQRADNSDRVDPSALLTVDANSGILRPGGTVAGSLTMPHSPLKESDITVAPTGVLVEEDSDLEFVSASHNNDDKSQGKQWCTFSCCVD